ncbi:Glycogenin-1 [Talaromyces pinophilus]|nr:Glycogenin-1 [Talaromyces pinophilus]
MSHSNSAYCTLLTNDNYLIAALVLAQSLKNTGTTIPLCVLITVAVSEVSIKRLKYFYDEIHVVPSISGVSTANLELIGRADLHTTLTKLNLWTLSRYERILYLDADTLVLSNLDHLFLLLSHVTFAASPELGFPDCFNSGVMLLKPNLTIFNDLTRLVEEIESFDGGDQGILNLYFSDGTRGHPMQQLLTEKENIGCTIHSWYRLSFTYNMEMHKVYRMYIPAVRRYQHEHKVLHFIGKEKPWHFPNGEVDHVENASAYYLFYGEMVKRWWDVHRQVEGQE